MATTFLITGSDEAGRKNEVSKLTEKIHSADLLEDKSEKKGINEVRAWQNWLNSTSGERKALWISHAEDLTPEAQNAFLKTLEEPPDNTIIILETENIHNILPTVLSRCKIIDTGSFKKTFSEKELLDLDLHLRLLGGGVGEKFALAQRLSTHRNDAENWIDLMASFLHSRLLEESTNPVKIKKLLETKRRLNSNVNVRLALENLFLKW